MDSKHLLLYVKPSIPADRRTLLRLFYKVFAGAVPIDFMCRPYIAISERRLRMLKLKNPDWFREPWRR